MHKRTITAAAAAAGILAAVLGQQTQTNATVTANSAAAIHTVLTAYNVAAAPSATPPDPTADTALTFTVGTSGLLTISAPASAFLGNGNVGTASVPVAIGVVTVTDTRSAANAAWTVTASSTGLSGPGTTIPASNLLYDPNSGTVNVTSGSVTPVIPTVPTGPPPGIPLTTTGAGTPPTVLSVTGSGNNTVTWNPTLSVNVPAGQVFGVYTGTLTHSLA